MVEVEMLTVAAGPQGVLQVGDKLWLTSEAAELYVSGGYARKTGRVKNEPEVKVTTDEAPIETATVKPPEVTVSRRGKRGKNA